MRVVFIILILNLTLNLSCDSALEDSTRKDLRTDSESAASDQLPINFDSNQVLIGKPGSKVRIHGEGFQECLEISLNNVPVTATFDGTNSMSFDIPLEAAPGEAVVKLSCLGLAAETSLLVLNDDGIPLFTGKPESMCSDFKYYDNSGVVSSGEKNCAPSAIPPKDCSETGETGCLSSVTFPAIEQTLIVPENLKNGFSIGEVVGEYPSVAFPLNNNTMVADLTTLGPQLVDAAAFEYWDSTGTRYSSNGDPDLTGSNIIVGTAIEFLGVNGSLPEGIAYSLVNYAGISSVDHIGANQVTVHWPSDVNAASFQVVDVTDPTAPVILSSTTGSATSVNVSGLTAATTYKFLVRHISDNGASDRNTASIEITTSTISTPIDIASLNMWLEATTLAGLNDGDPVTSWTDTSFGGNDGLQSTPANQAVYRTNVIGALGAVEFDGSDAIEFLGIDFTDSFTLVAVLKTSLTHQIDGESNSGTGGTGGQNYAWEPRNGGGVAGGGVSYGTNGISVYEHADAYMPATAVYSSASVAANFNVVTIVYEDRIPKIYLNGVLVRTGLVSGKSVVRSPSRFGMGGYGGLTGFAAELAIFDENLADADRVKVEDYLKAKYGL